MRAFVRCEDGRVVTLWMNETASVAELKRVVAASGRTAIAAGCQRLLLGATELSDGDALKQHLCRAKTPAQGSSLHLVLLPRPDPRHGQQQPRVAPVPQATAGGAVDAAATGAEQASPGFTVHPAPNTTAIGLNAPVTLRAHNAAARQLLLRVLGAPGAGATGPAAPAVTVDVRSARDRPCEGVVQWFPAQPATTHHAGGQAAPRGPGASTPVPSSTAPGSAQSNADAVVGLTFTPAESLLPNTAYTCYVSARCRPSAAAGRHNLGPGDGGSGGLGAAATACWDCAWTFTTIALGDARCTLWPRARARSALHVCRVHAAHCICCHMPSCHHNRADSCPRVCTACVGCVRQAPSASPSPRCPPPEPSC